MDEILDLIESVFCGFFSLLFLKPQRARLSGEKKNNVWAGVAALVSFIIRRTSATSSCGYAVWPIASFSVCAEKSLTPAETQGLSTLVKNTERRFCRLKLIKVQTFA